jgi:hypothetical protein
MAEEMELSGFEFDDEDPPPPPEPSPAEANGWNTLPGIEMESGEKSGEIPPPQHGPRLMAGFMMGPGVTWTDKDLAYWLGAIQVEILKAYKGGYTISIEVRKHEPSKSPLPPDWRARLLKG